MKDPRQSMAGQKTRSRAFGGLVLLFSSQSVLLAFLYEYREPTFGILYSQVATSTALLHERKDVVFKAVNGRTKDEE
jgi:hypothetical protein